MELKCEIKVFSGRNVNLFTYKHELIFGLNTVRVCFLVVSVLFRFLFCFCGGGGGRSIL